MAISGVFGVISAGTSVSGQVVASVVSQAAYLSVVVDGLVVTDDDAVAWLG